MNHILIGIFVLLVLLLLLGLIQGTMLVFGASALLYYYFIFLVLYYPLYFLARAFFPNRSKLTVQIGSIVLLIGIFWGATIFQHKMDNYTTQKAMERAHKIRLNALQDVPPNAEISNNQHFKISTDNLKDELSNQPTFKWDGFELTSFETGHDTITVESLTPPQTQLKKISCGKKLTFIRKAAKDTTYSRLEETRDFQSENYELSQCQVDKLSLLLNKQAVTLTNTILHHHTNSELAKEPDFIKEAADKLNLTEYWFSESLPIDLKVENRWRSNNFYVLFDITGMPAALLSDISHFTGINNMMLKQCQIKQNVIGTIFTHLQDEKPMLSLTNFIGEDVPAPCLDKMNVSVTYSLEQGITPDEKAFILQPFSHLNDKIEITWAQKPPYLQRLDNRWTYNNPAFFWGDLKLKSFEINRDSTISVSLDNDSPGTIKFGAFNCISARLKHKENPLGDTLDKKNFIVNYCGYLNANQVLFIDGTPIEIGQHSWLNYFSFGKGELDGFKKILKTKINQTQFPLLYVNLDYFKNTTLNLDGSPVKLLEAVTTPQGEVIALYAEIWLDEKNETPNFGECKPIDSNYSVFLENFSNAQVDVLVNNCNEIYRLPYQIVSGE